jgi:hypothetical protein
MVIRGFTAELDMETVKADLMSRGFHPSKVIRMRSFRKKRQPLPLSLFKLPRCEARIYDLKSIGYISVPVDP